VFLLWSGLNSAQKTFTGGRSVKATRYLRAWIKFYTNFLHFYLIRIEFGTGDVYKQSMNGCGFCEKRLSENCTLHTAVIWFISVLLSFIVWFVCNLVYEIWHIMLKHLYVPWKQEQDRPYFTYGCTGNDIYGCSIKVCDFNRQPFLWHAETQASYSLWLRITTPG